MISYTFHYIKPITILSLRRLLAFDFIYIKSIVYGWTILEFKFATFYILHFKDVVRRFIIHCFYLE